jgi:ATP-binding cassette subfamily C protein
LIGAQVTYLALTGTTAEAEQAREVLGGTQRPAAFREIRLDHVTFAHAETPVLRDVSLRIPSGQITAIFGPSGAGKTTIVDLVIGLNRPDQGTVTIDGVSLEDIDIAWWRGRIGYVPQETVMFNDSIFRNVTLGAPELTRDDALRALSAAGLDEFVVSLPNGIDTNVGERGNRVSGGQRQRLAIARALVRKPVLLIFDEATTSLDPETETGILATLRQLAGGNMTVIAISHQPALLKAADTIYRISEGTIELENRRRAAVSAGA